ncbi:MAG: TonB-dependent receptor [Myxococcota bacterium]|nr:TonB-dependent receptor [Myxococcota bacterium]
MVSSSIPAVGHTAPTQHMRPDGEAEETDQDLSVEPTTAPDEIYVQGARERPSATEGRALVTLDADQLIAEIPRSVPEALHGRPGLSTQQTAHGQGSVYIRGRTGRHTLILFDGFRLTHALFRKGPNQYLFTVDSESLESVEVLRGAASVNLGANALAGAIITEPRRAPLDPTQAGLKVMSTLRLTHGSADQSWGQRGELALQLSPHWAILAGVGRRTAGELEAAGPLPKTPLPEGIPIPVEEKEVPRFREGGRIQMGTGYRIWSGDARLRWRPSAQADLSLGLYIFRQYDTPRTDQCPPPETPDAWCLQYDEQFRTQITSRAKMKPRWQLLNKLDGGISYLRQHERRTNDRVNYLNGGRDSLDGWLARISATARPLLLPLEFRLRLTYGFDGSDERVSSRAWDVLVNSKITRHRSRGPYLEGSSYQQGALWFAPTLDWHALSLRAGLRQTWIYAEAPADVESSSEAIDRHWSAPVGRIGLSWRLNSALQLTGGFEQGFSPPNLDDLTARQITGQGFQLENPALEPEYSDTWELGLQLKSRWVSAELWAYWSTLEGAMERRDANCPPGDRGCRSLRRAIPVRLVNLDQPAELWGTEGSIEVQTKLQQRFNIGASYARGEGPSPIERERRLGRKRPLSRVPPLNGWVTLSQTLTDPSLELAWDWRWARAQDALSYGDELDLRIPFGGTPGYQLHNLRLDLKGEEGLRLSLLLENIFDRAYRVHGSSINGAGRGFRLSLSWQLS